MQTDPLHGSLRTVCMDSKERPERLGPGKCNSCSHASMKEEVSRERVALVILRGRGALCKFLAQLAR